MQRTLADAHGQDLALEIAVDDAPLALVNHERGLVREAGVRVGLCDDPCGGVRDALQILLSLYLQTRAQNATHQIQDFALHDEVVQAVHNLFDARVIIPPVQVEDVDVVRAQLLQRAVQGHIHRLEIVADKTCLLLLVAALPATRVLLGMCQ